MRKRRMSEYDLDLDEENSDLDTSFEKNDRESDEDTEDASETDMVKQEEEYTEIKEQMYQDKLSNLKKQLQQLEERTHPEYVKRHKKLEQCYQDRLLFNEVFQKCEIERVEREYEIEQEAAAKEFEEKKIELKENLIVDLEEKKKMIEAERCTMELTGGLKCAVDSMEVKPVTTRKLRRRPNDPLPLPEKRRKTSPNILFIISSAYIRDESNLGCWVVTCIQYYANFRSLFNPDSLESFFALEFDLLCLGRLNYVLEEGDILEDLKIMSKGKYQVPNKSRHESLDGMNASEHSVTSFEVRVEDGKLYYDKKWFHRGQPIFYEGKEADSKNSALICGIGPGEILVKRMEDAGKLRITVSQLQKGRYILTRRST